MENSRPLAVACGRVSSASSRSSRTGSKGAASTIKRPASAVSESRVAFSTAIRSLAAARAAPSCSREGAARPFWPAAAASTWVTPVRPLRISCDRVATRSDLDRARCSACISDCSRSPDSRSRSAARANCRLRFRFISRAKRKAREKAPQVSTASWCVSGLRNRATSGPAMAAGATISRQAIEDAAKNMQITAQATAIIMIVCPAGPALRPSAEI